MNILIAGIIIVLCVLLNKISSKVGVPALLFFIVLGLLFGKEGIFKLNFYDFDLAAKICTTALIFIMFYGGFGTSWEEAKNITGRALILSVLGTIITTLIVAAFSYYCLKFKLLESVLLGSVISSTDAASVFSVLRSNKLNLKEHTASLLELESGSNDPISYMLTAITLTLMGGNISGGKIFYMFFAQITYAMILAFIISSVAYYFLRRANFGTNGFDSVFTIGIAILSYAIPEAIGGNGYLCTYVTGIILGNKTFEKKIDLVHFFNGVTGLMQVVIFFMLGLLALPSKLTENSIPAILVFLVLTFIARPIAVFVILYFFKSSSLAQKILVSWSGLRGAASIVFAIVANVSHIDLDIDIYHIVFFIVLLSISSQGTLIAFMAKKLDFIDSEEDVMKTFNDYQDEEPVGFIQVNVDINHPWFNKSIKDIKLPKGILVASIVRSFRPIAPNGDTVILNGDRLIISALRVSSEIETKLTEMEVSKKEIGKQIKELDIHSGRLVILIKRKGHIFIPDGNTIIEKGDKLVINNTIPKYIENSFNFI